MVYVLNVACGMDNIIAHDDELGHLEYYYNDIICSDDNFGFEVFKKSVKYDNFKSVESYEEVNNDTDSDTTMIYMQTSHALPAFNSKPLPSTKPNLFKSRYPQFNSTFLEAMVRNTSPNLTINNSSTIHNYSVPQPVTPSPKVSKAVLEYDRKISFFSNVSDLQGIKDLIEYCYASNCIISLSSSVVNVQVRGPSIIFNVLSELSDMYPDSVMKVIYSKEYKDVNGKIFIKSKIGMIGTLAKVSAIPPCLEKYKSKSVEGLVCEFACDSSPQTQKLMREREMLLRSKNKFIRCEFEAIVKHYISKYTGKIRMSGLKVRLVRIVN